MKPSDRRRLCAALEYALEAGVRPTSRSFVEDAARLSFDSLNPSRRSALNARDVGLVGGNMTCSVPGVVGTRGCMDTPLRTAVNETSTSL